MILQHGGNLKRTSTDYRPGPGVDGDMAHLVFDGFGATTARAPEFAAFFEWQDVEELVRVFVDMKCSEAMRLTRVRDVATAIEALAKVSSPLEA